jgi:hypothetical protein
LRKQRLLQALEASILDQVAHSFPVSHNSAIEGLLGSKGEEVVLGVTAQAEPVRKGELVVRAAVGLFT